MTTIKLKFRPSTIANRMGSLYYQININGETHKIKSGHKIYKEEWNKETCEIILPPTTSCRYKILESIRYDISWDIQRLKQIIEEYGCQDSGLYFSDIVNKFRPCISSDNSVFTFMKCQISRKKEMGKIRTSETYQATLNSFMHFRKGIDLTFDMIDSDLIERYETELKSKGLKRNTTSFYMRILRTNYKLGVERNLTKDRKPFKHVYCGMDKTQKRSISLSDIKRINSLDLKQKPCLDFARDMFIFSFCTRGMSFIDMAYLKKTDLRNGFLTYRRKKTDQQLTIEWTEHMQRIVDKYNTEGTQYLLPIIVNEDGTERRQYINQIMRVNRKLKEIASLIGLSVPLSLYYSRHSWATIARYKEIPLSVISEGLGHDSEITTQIYLDSIKACEVDKANMKILKEIQ